MNIAVFCSGYGSNFQAIADAARENFFKGRITIMVCDNKDAFALERAKKEGIPTLLALRENFKTREDFENKIIRELDNQEIGLVCLAGFMRILTPEFIERYKDRVINVHPSLLPSFKGTSGIKDAFEYAVKITGVTVHFVTQELDSGPIILQEPVKIESTDTEKTLEEKIHAVEHRLYPEAIKLFCEGKLKIKGKKVYGY
ncbi:MAG: phosphoribosylglycinamide formyltransferase [Candidatus Omnitrophica bacterium]|nr:phosphoribosylglycinamide formyltransferase [Candidatus Omnitrophota bacterium]